MGLQRYAVSGAAGWIGRLWTAGLLVCLAVMMAGCSGAHQLEGTPPTLTPNLAVTKKLVQLPPPARQIDVGVYGFPDLTGQYKPNDNFSELSNAVTQGAVNFLIEALLRTGGGSWFRVVERQSLNNVMQERRIINGMRAQFANGQADPVPPLRFAGIMLDGGIVGFDSNVFTGGAGARYLGVGADTQYRRDIVTVSLRAVSVQTGEILAAVSTAKTIYSMALNGSAFRFVSIDEILEAEAGFTVNEPVQLAVRQAIELAIYALIQEGVVRNMWSYEDRQAGLAEVLTYTQVRHGGIHHERTREIIEPPAFGEHPPVAW